MIKARRKFLLVAFALGLLFGLALLYPSGTRRPKLTVTYLTRTNVSGRWIAQFAITNFGDAAAISLQGYSATRQGFATQPFSQGVLEMFGQTQMVVVACRPQLHRLSPGGGDVIQVFLPPGFQGRWRFTCPYAREGLRSRISDWQWGAGGPGPRANRFMPRFLNGVPFDVGATSDWIDE